MLPLKMGGTHARTIAAESLAVSPLKPYAVDEKYKERYHGIERRPQSFLAKNELVAPILRS